MLEYAGTALLALGGFGSAIETGKAGTDAQNEAIRTGVMARFEARRRARDIREEGEYFLSDQATRYAKSGVIIDQGSPALVRMETMRRIESDAIRTEQYGEERQRQLDAEGDMLAKQSRLLATSQSLRTAGTLLTSYGRYSQSYKPPTSITSIGGDIDSGMFNVAGERI